MKMLIAAAAIGAIAAPAIAENVQFEVDYRDINLASPEGQQVLDKRIDKAARKACGYDKVPVGSRLPSRDAKACYEELRAKAQKQFAVIIDRETKGG